jgi:thymidylate synthase
MKKNGENNKLHALETLKTPLAKIQEIQNKMQQETNVEELQKRGNPFWTCWKAWKK